MNRSTLVIGASGVLLAFVAVALAQQETPPATQSRSVLPGGAAPAAPGYSTRVRTYPSQTAVVQVQVPHSEPKVNELVRKWKAAEDDDAREKAQDEIRAALKEAFESRLTAHEQQIQELELEVKRLREQLERRREKQDEIVDFRLQQVLREAQGLGWGTDNFAPSTNPYRANLPSAPDTFAPVRRR
jgi:hypothetical protein